MSATPLPRRQVLAGLAGLPATTIPTPLTALAAGGDLVALWTRARELRGMMSDHHGAGGEFSAAFCELAWMDHVIPTTPAAGLADALAALAWARAEFTEFHVGDDEPDRGDLVLLALLDKVAEALGGLA